MMLILGLILSFSLSANEKIRGHYKLVGNKPDSNSIKKVVFEEFINFGCSHCNKLHKASKDFRKKFADKIEFVDIPIVFKGQDDSPLRLYYVARKIGKGDLIKDELFKASFIHGVNVFDPGITNYLARSLGIRKEFQKEKDQQWVNQLIREGLEGGRVFLVPEKCLRHFYWNGGLHCSFDYCIRSSIVSGTFFTNASIDPYFPVAIFKAC